MFVRYHYSFMTPNCYRILYRCADVNASCECMMQDNSSGSFHYIPASKKREVYSFSSLSVLPSEKKKIRHFFLRIADDSHLFFGASSASVPNRAYWFHTCTCQHLLYFLFNNLVFLIFIFKCEFFSWTTDDNLLIFYVQPQCHKMTEIDPEE